MSTAPTPTRLVTTTTPEGGVRVFAVQDPTTLKGFGPGDRVRFEVDRDGRGFVVTRLENSN